MGKILYSHLSTHIIIPSGDETFGCFLRDKDLNIVQENGIAKMYNIRAAPKPEQAVVRDFNLETLEVSERKVVMNADSDSDWASPHYALKIADDFYILFWTIHTRQIRASISTSYDGIFTHIPKDEFLVSADGTWDIGGIEQDVGARKISEDEQYIYYWMLHSSTGYVHDNSTPSHSGWYKIRVDKINKKVEYLEKYPNNPITAINIPYHTQNRVGGSNTETLICGKYAMFHMIMNTTYSDEKIAVSFSNDPMFNHVEQKEILGLTSTFDSHIPEDYMEKFDYYYNSKGEVVLVYESCFQTANYNKKFGVVARKYRFYESSDYVLKNSFGEQIVLTESDVSKVKTYINGKKLYFSFVNVDSPKASKQRICLNGEVKAFEKL